MKIKVSKGIEIKATSSLTKAATSGITAFRKTYPRLFIQEGLVLCLADHSYKLSENDTAMPWYVKAVK